MRSQGTCNLLYLFEDFGLDTGRRELRRGAELVAVEPKIFDLIEFLVRNRDRVVSRDELIKAVWSGRIVSESALSSSINAARSALDDSGEGQRLIRTLQRKGVRFVGTVREKTHSADGAHPEPPQPGVFALPDKPSIAVLPFSNITGDTEHEYFVDGMAEEIITALSHCRSLFVISRNSSFTYKDKSIDVREVGRDLGVRYVLEGSVRRAGKAIRITGRLVDAISGAHIWADRFDGEMSDIFDLQDQITGKVVAAIEPNLQLAEIERLRRKPAKNFDAYDLLLRAQQFEYEFTPESLSAALRCLEKALAIDPNYAAAMALTAYCYAERRVQGWMQDASAELQEGVRLAHRAIEFGKDDTNVLWMAAYAIRQLTMDARRAKDLADRALSLNPNSAVALTVAGWSELALANSTKALDLFQRAERLSPRDPRGWFIAAGLGLAFFLEGEFDRAVSAAKRALLGNPRSAVALQIFAATLATSGKTQEAAAVVKELRNIDPNLTISLWRARTMFIEKAAQEKIAAGLRLAGLPE